MCDRYVQYVGSARWDQHARGAIYAACALVMAVLRALNTPKYSNSVLRACTAV